MNVKKVLYISYDGMTDPLGQSQILPYLAGLSRFGYSFTILSFEKSDRFASRKDALTRMMRESNISWVPMSFTKNPPLVAKFYDAIRMKRKAFALQRKNQFDMVHCRSYIAADIGLAMKKKFGTLFFFDMRGFWADEKRDGGAWKDNHPVFKRVYSYYKKKEAEYLQHADYIISLTESGKKELQTWKAFNPSVPVSVIPCCADTNHFSVTSHEQKLSARARLGIDGSRLVVSYLGSIGAWYMLDEMLLMFTCIKKKYPDAFFLFVSHSDKNTIQRRAANFSIRPQDMLVVEASRDEVPLFIKASDINISFIKPVYSKISSSPTKLGEVLSMGIPVIVNAGVGDVEKIVTETRSGIVLNDFSLETMEKSVAQIPVLLQLEPETIRENSKQIFDLGNGISQYEKAYRSLFEKPAIPVAS